MGKLLWVFIASFVIGVAKGDQTVYEKLWNDPELSQFYELLTSNQQPNFTLNFRQATIFAPTNRAFQYFKGKMDKSLVLYHISNLPKTTDQLESFVKSEQYGNPPLWVTQHHDNIYVNNAKIIMNMSNFEGVTANNSKQILHVIDEVLQPVVLNPLANNPPHNPNAYQFLLQFENIDLGPHRLREFRRRVYKTGKLDIFNKEGKYTFFMPVDQGFSSSEHADMLDAEVIDGHVIPNHVLFTTPSRLGHPFETLALEDNLKVTVSFKRDSENKNSKVYIYSNTLIGDSKHPTGVVRAEIVRANIPVKNGVIHLIQRPLMVVDLRIAEVFEMMKDDGPLTKFYEIMQDSEYGRTFFKTLKRLNSGTVFAPSNTAWQDENLKNLLNSEKLEQILSMHLVRDHRLTVERIKHYNQNQFPTDARKNLYFNFMTKDNEQVLTVEGGGVNATVIQADLTASDGVIHIIDKVLGVPHLTVLDKLRSDPMLVDTYNLGMRQGFNKQLNDTTRRFTYFVPRNKAWRKTEVTMPTTIKKLFMPEFSYHAIQILERHLVIRDIPYTVEALKQEAAKSPTNEVELPSVRDVMRIRIEEKETSFTIIWRGEKIQVFRPDIECTNGVIHVIDLPLLQEEDFQVTAAKGVAMTVNLALCFMLAAVKWLLL